ncbi:hypothetical protein BUALT_Bualt07G0115900 [Buddleja alternifolia]|uniref:Uncharacterized protein n=1 Tax=Buddleja alternifolia TaxID=168488 RepID=A0AAV6XI45_9LAMI|nr:hypothetical protein BUALT_Bualt07G0115900 [Buddleja alternifolia]
MSLNAKVKSRSAETDGHKEESFSSSQFSADGLSSSPPFAVALRRRRIVRQPQSQAMPTFLLLKQGKEVERVIGDKKDELQEKILKHREAPKFAA